MWERGLWAGIMRGCGMSRGRRGDSALQVTHVTLCEGTKHSGLALIHEIICIHHNLYCQYLNSIRNRTCEAAPHGPNTS